MTGRDASNRIMFGYTVAVLIAGCLQSSTHHCSRTKKWWLGFRMRGPLACGWTPWTRGSCCSVLLQCGWGVERRWYGILWTRSPWTFWALGIAATTLKNLGATACVPLCVRRRGGWRIAVCPFAALDLLVNFRALSFLNSPAMSCHKSLGENR